LRPVSFCFDSVYWNSEVGVFRGVLPQRLKPISSAAYRRAESPAPPSPGHSKAGSALTTLSCSRIEPNTKSQEPRSPREAWITSSVPALLRGYLPARQTSQSFWQKGQPDWQRTCHKRLCPSMSRAAATIQMARPERISVS